MKKPAGSPEVPEGLGRIATAWREAVRLPRLRAWIAGWVLFVFGALLLARTGTPKARLATFALLTLGIVATVLAAWIERRTFSDARRIIERLFGRSEPELASRAQRALRLSYRPADGTSEALARLHLTRALSALPEEQVKNGAKRSAFLFGIAALILSGASLGTCVMRGFGVVEGADVLLASGGKAPMDLGYLTEPELVARPPEYLHEPEHRHAVYGDLMLPNGTLLTVRGRAVHDGRTIVLTDGTARVPFFDDGSGKIIARWPLTKTVNLRVAAVFGDVVIEEPLSTNVQAIADDPPRVLLESAPREVKLAVDTDVPEIPLRYEATDDHGMREVHLVLRAGAKEERRMLAKLDGETRVDRGGSTLRVTDPFVKKSHVPVFVTVEAKDNDAVTGPKWGKSEAIVLVPPSVAQAEALRLAALMKVRDTYVDALARRLSVTLPKDAKERRTLGEGETHASENEREQLDNAVRTSYIGLSVPKRLIALLFTHAAKIDKAVGAFSRAPSQSSLDAVVASNEKFVGVIDAVISGLAQKDARSSAKELADVADDMATGFFGLEAMSPEGRPRVSAAHSVLAEGGAALSHLGTLGHELGEITQAYLLRIDRADKAQDNLHAALAARDLAARLAVPDPSLGSHGKSGRAGAESGGTPGADDPSDSPGDDVAQAFDEAARDLNQLAMDHAEEMGNVERESGQTSPEDLKELGKEMKERADRIRNAVKGLPEVGGSPESMGEKARGAREQAEQMAKSLEEENVSDAVSAGKSALSRLEEAKRAADRERLWGGDPATEKKLDEAAQKLEPELKATQRMLEELKRKSEQRAARDLGKHGDAEQKLSERMKALGERGRERSLPDQALRDLEDARESAKQAANAFKQGDMKRGKDKQKDAQKKLEEAQRNVGDDQDNGNKDDGDSRAPGGEHADIPTADAHKGPEEFRRRVMKGLAMPTPSKERDAVLRYAEGLLK